MVDGHYTMKRGSEIAMCSQETWLWSAYQSRMSASADIMVVGDIGFPCKFRGVHLAMNYPVYRFVNSNNNQ